MANEVEWSTYDATEAYQLRTFLEKSNSNYTMRFTCVEHQIDGFMQSWKFTINQRVIMEAIARGNIV